MRVTRMQKSHTCTRCATVIAKIYAPMNELISLHSVCLGCETNNIMEYSVIVIIEISSAHGYKNSTSSNSNEVIHGPELISQHSKKGKNYTKY